MRVLYFHQHFTTPKGSSGTRSYEFAKALISRGHQVTMVCGLSSSGGLSLTWNEEMNWHEGTIDGIEVIALPLAYSNRDNLVRRTWLFLRFAWRGIAIALRREFDLLFATSTPLTAALPGIGMKLVGSRKSFVFEVRDLWPELPRALGMRNPFALWGMSFLEWIAYRAADACVGLSPGIVDGIKRRAPEGRTVEMIPNGCDLDLFTPNKRCELRLPGVLETDFVAGFTGTHGIANGLDAVLDAALELKRRSRSDIKLVLIGDGRCKPALVARAERQQLDNVIFLPPMKKVELSHVTASFDCGLQILADVPAFYFGTSPNKFFDYLSSGIPVLCNYPGWLAELIEEHNCGVVVRPSDPVAFADALSSLASSLDVASMGRSARHLAESEFGRQQLSGAFVRLIESEGQKVKKCLAG